MSRREDRRAAVARRSFLADSGLQLVALETRMAFLREGAGRFQKPSIHLLFSPGGLGLAGFFPAIGVAATLGAG